MQSFDAIVRRQLMELVEKRIGDSSLLRLIRKWIHVGVLEEGRLLVTDTGVGQGQVISPVLANIYLHYVLDEWFEHVVKPRLRGAAFEIWYADDFILCFQYREDAARVQRALTLDSTVIGHVRLTETSLHTDTNSQKRADAHRQGHEPVRPSKTNELLSRIPSRVGT